MNPRGIHTPKGKPPKGKPQKARHHKGQPRHHKGGHHVARSVYGPQLLGSAPAVAAAPVAEGPAALAHPEAHPTEVHDFFAQPVQKLHDTAAGIIQVHTNSDLLTLQNDQRAMVQNPNTASACIVAREQIQAMEIEKDTAAAAHFDATQVRDLTDKHEDLRHGAIATAEYLTRVDQAHTVVLADRTEARAQVRAFIESTIAAMKPGDPRHARFVAAQAHIQSAEDKYTQQGQAQHDQRAQARDAALGRLHDAEADLQLAEVVHLLEQGIQPDQEKMILAARYLKKKLAEQGAGTSVDLGTASA